MSTIDLGKIKFVWRGAYNNSTAYTPDDVVSSGGSSYICILASTGNAVSNGTYWQQMSAAGTNGTDLTSTLGTQGQIVYRDGSGLAALNAGTSGQVLQTGGTGANPSWGTVSSDFVKLHETDLTSGNPSSFTIANVFSSTYKTYKIFYALTLASNHYIHFAVQNSSASNQGGQYYSKWYQITEPYTTHSGGTGDQQTGDGFRVMNTWYSSSSEHADVGELTLYNPSDTTSRTQAIWRHSWNQGQNDHMGHTIGYGRCSNVGGGTHLNINASGGDFENSSGVYDAYITVYGLK